MHREQVLALHQCLTHKAYALLKKKSQDYANEKHALRNFFASTYLGVDPCVSILIRMQDKLGRLSNLVTSNGKVQVIEESITDTVIDLINYAVLFQAVFLEKTTQTTVDSDVMDLLLSSLLPDNASRKIAALILQAYGTWSKEPVLSHEYRRVLEDILYCLQGGTRAEFLARAEKLIYVHSPLEAERLYEELYALFEKAACSWPTPDVADRLLNLLSSTA